MVGPTRGGQTRKRVCEGVVASCTVRNIGIYRPLKALAILCMLKSIEGQVISAPHGIYSATYQKLQLEEKYFSTLLVLSPTGLKYLRILTDCLRVHRLHPLLFTLSLLGP